MLSLFLSEVNKGKIPAIIRPEQKILSGVVPVLAGANISERGNIRRVQLSVVAYSDITSL